MKAFSKYLLILLTVCLSSASSSFATHVLGGEIYYVHEPLPNDPYRFRVVLHYYRFCNGIDAPLSLTLNITPVSPCSGAAAFPTQVMTRNNLLFSGDFFSGFFFPYFDNNNGPFIVMQPIYNKRKFRNYPTSCQPNSNLLPTTQLINDVNIYYYATYVSIPQTQQCNQWLFWTTECCRNDIVNISSPLSRQTLNEAMVNTSFMSPTDIANGVRQNSARFRIPPTHYIPVNQRSFISPGVSESDGDSLSFNFGQIKSSNPSDIVPYVGVSVSNTFPIQPFPSNAFQPNGTVQIDPETGVLAMIPSSISRFVTVIQCDEWRRVNNVPVKVGYTRRDAEFITYSGNLPLLQGVNTNPVVSTINGSFDGPLGNGTQVDFNKYKIVAPTCETTCFTIRCKRY